MLSKEIENQLERLFIPRTHFKPRAYFKKSDFCKRGHDFLITRRISGKNSYCSECRRSRERQRWHDNKNPRKLLEKREYERGRNLRKYGITFAQALAMYEFQDNKCAICLRDVQPLTRDFAVDHNHTTGLVRGILCTRCNTGLGMFRENPFSLGRAMEYLKRPTTTMMPLVSAGKNKQIVENAGVL